MDFKKEFDLLLETELEEIKGGMSDGEPICAVCCSKENGGNSTGKEEEEDDDPPGNKKP